MYNHNWNDYGFYTWFTLWYIPARGERVIIGDMKIMNSGGDAYDMMKGSFDKLDDSFCSVGLDTSFY